MEAITFGMLGSPFFIQSLISITIFLIPDGHQTPQDERQIAVLDLEDNEFVVANKSRGEHKKGDMELKEIAETEEPVVQM